MDVPPPADPDGSVGTKKKGAVVNTNQTPRISRRQFVSTGLATAATWLGPGHLFAQEGPRRRWTVISALAASLRAKLTMPRGGFLIHPDFFTRLVYARV